MCQCASSSCPPQRAVRRRRRSLRWATCSVQISMVSSHFSLSAFAGKCSRGASWFRSDGHGLTSDRFSRWRTLTNLSSIAAPSLKRSFPHNTKRTHSPLHRSASLRLTSTPQLPISRPAPKQRKLRVLQSGRRRLQLGGVFPRYALVQHPALRLC
jgi:hypothetical protein